MVLREGKARVDDTIHSTQVSMWLSRLRVKTPLITSELNTMKYNRKVIGYQILITDNRRLDKVYFIQTNRLVYDIITFLKFYTYLFKIMSKLFLTKNIHFLVEVVKMCVKMEDNIPLDIISGMCYPHRYMDIKNRIKKMPLKSTPDTKLYVGLFSHLNHNIHNLSCTEILLRMVSAIFVQIICKRGNHYEITWIKLL